MFEHEYLEYLPLYVTGALPAEEKRRLEAHLQEGCAICEPELFMFNETASRMAYSLPQHKLSPDLKDKIWKRIEEAGYSAKSESPYRKVLLAAAAAFALFVITGSVLWQQNLQQIKMQKEIAKLQRSLRQQEEQIAWLQDPAVQLAMLTGQSIAPKAKGKMVWNPGASRGIFYVNYLPSVPAQKSYQLWVIGKSGPVSAGVFQTDQEGSAVVIVSQLPSSPQGPLQFAVTVEPHGGVPQPTGSMVLAGKPL